MRSAILPILRIERGVHADRISSTEVQLECPACKAVTRFTWQK
jgi:hypothetical protein